MKAAFRFMKLFLNKFDIGTSEKLKEIPNNLKIGLKNKE